MRHTYFRRYQQIMRVVMKQMPWREPEVIHGAGSIGRLPDYISKADLQKVLVVTDRGIVDAGLMNPLLEGLEERGIDYSVYRDTVANPTVENVEDALEQYYRNQCQGIIAFGGGSAMDCAKGTGARLARADRTIPEMKGTFKLRRNMPPFFAVPTTSGTGSEGTLAAVISDGESREKYALMDTSLIPHFAVLDSELTLDMPPHITSTTGMDALTHAVEAYIGHSNTAETSAYALEATEIIFEHLQEAYEDGHDTEARERMQHAAYIAGLAFTRAYVGNIHAIAHTLGGFYNVPHGLANAVIMPHVLEYYGDAVYGSLADLADAARLTAPEDSDRTKAYRFIEGIRKLNGSMDIPDRIEEIEEADIPAMVERAYAEANPLYPVPVIFDREDFTNIYRRIMA